MASSCGVKRRPHHGRDRLPIRFKKDKRPECQIVRRSRGLDADLRAGRIFDIACVSWRSGGRFRP